MVFFAVLKLLNVFWRFLVAITENVYRAAITNSLIKHNTSYLLIIIKR